MRIVARADTDEPVVPIPGVVKPIEVELAIRLVAIDDEHIRIAIGVEPICKAPSVPSPFEYSQGGHVFGIIIP